MLCGGGGVGVGVRVQLYGHSRKGSGGGVSPRRELGVLGCREWSNSGAGGARRIF